MTAITKKPTPSPKTTITIGCRRNQCKRPRSKCFSRNLEIGKNGCYLIYL